MTLPRPRSLYDVLNVSSDAEPVVIEAAYKALIKKYHPDQAGDAGPFSPDATALNKAFSVLKDPSRRAAYDHKLWTREQAMRAAELAPVPPRRSRIAGAAGWVVAIILGGVVAVMAGGRGLPETSATGAAPAEAAALPTPAFLESGRAEAEMEAIVAAARRAPVLPPVPPEQAEAKPPAAPLGDARRIAAEAAPTAPPRRRPPRRQPAPQPQEEPVAEGEFLEREGYIY